MKAGRKSSAPGRSPGGRAEVRAVVISEDVWRMFWIFCEFGVQRYGGVRDRTLTRLYSYFAVSLIVPQWAT